jgi:hypothetical protein
MPVIAGESKARYFWREVPESFLAREPRKTNQGNSEISGFLRPESSTHHRHPGRRETQTVTNPDKPSDVAEEAR